jgi:hypothetical protein
MWACRVLDTHKVSRNGPPLNRCNLYRCRLTRSGFGAVPSFANTQALQLSLLNFGKTPE